MLRNAAITPQRASHKSNEKMDNMDYRTPQEFEGELRQKIATVTINRYTTFSFWQRNLKLSLTPGMSKYRYSLL